MSKRYTCPCCGYKTLSSFPGSYEICEICFWEDDGVQLCDPSYAGGANQPSLIEAQRNFESFGANSEREHDCVRAPNTNEQRDPSWRHATAADVPFGDNRPGDRYPQDQLEHWYYWLR